MKNLHRKTSHLKRDDPRMTAAFNGWHDALNGRPLNPYFSDNRSSTIAVTYMNWRLRATAIKWSGIKVPAWRSTRQVPHQVKDAWVTVVRGDKSLGMPDVMPLVRMPDDPNLMFA